jgi:hypothetical protein
MPESLSEKLTASLALGNTDDALSAVIKHLIERAIRFIERSAHPLPDLNDSQFKELAASIMQWSEEADQKVAAREAEGFQGADDTNALGLFIAAKTFGAIADFMNTVHTNVSALVIHGVKFCLLDQCGEQVETGKLERAEEKKLRLELQNAERSVWHQEALEAMAAKDAQESGVARKVLYGIGVICAKKYGVTVKDSACEKLIRDKRDQYDALVARFLESPTRQAH